MQLEKSSAPLKRSLGHSPNRLSEPTLPIANDRLIGSRDQLRLSDFFLTGVAGLFRVQVPVPQ